MKIISFCFAISFALSLSHSVYAAETNVGTITEPDNSGINKRDDSVVEMTAEDQSNNPKALAITRKIRAELNQNKSLSTYAKNIKIITNGKWVILKGPVRSQDEINIINKTAAKMAMDYKIQNELEVTRK